MPATAEIMKLAPDDALSRRRALIRLCGVGKRALQLANGHPQARMRCRHDRFQIASRQAEGADPVSKFILLGIGDIEADFQLIKARLRQRRDDHRRSSDAQRRNNTQPAERPASARAIGFSDEGFIKQWLAEAVKIDRVAMARQPVDQQDEVLFAHYSFAAGK
jgi:hypothetical protein